MITCKAVQSIHHPACSSILKYIRSPHAHPAPVPNQGLDKATIGDYLGEREPFALKVMHAYVDALDFSGLELDDAIRTFLSGFRCALGGGC